MLLTVHAATEKAGYVKVDTLQRPIKDGRLPSQELGGLTFVLWEDVVAYMQGRADGCGRPRGPVLARSRT